MIGILRLGVAFGAALLAMHFVGGAPYIEQVFVVFAVAALAAAAVREGFLPSARPLGSLTGDLAISIILAVLMLLAVRAAGRVTTAIPSPVLPALVWPLIDLWRPGSRRRSSR